MLSHLFEQFILLLVSGLFITGFILLIPAGKTPFERFEEVLDDAVLAGMIGGLGILFLVHQAFP